MSYVYYKTELQLTDLQKEIIDNGIRLQRNMWNYLVANVNKLVNNKEIKILTYNTELEKELFNVFFEDIKNSGLSTRIVRSVVDNYVKAWKNCFNRNMQNHKEPKFHSYKKYTQSLLFIDTPTNVKNNTFKLSLWRSNYKQFVEFTNPYKANQVQLELKEKNTKFFNKFTEYKSKHFAITRRRNRYFISICYKCEYKKEKSKDNSIGLDWGLVDYFTDSNGKKHNIPKRATRQLERIKSLQKVLSKKQKGSKNYNKIVNKISNAWYRYDNIKKDYIEKLTLELLRENNLIVIEDIDLIEMRNKTHKSRRRNMNLNSFSDFKEILIKKQIRFPETKIIQVDKYFKSSQICSCCGMNTGKKSTNIREFTCQYCGVHHDRDINAAINIHNKGIRLSCS